STTLAMSAPQAGKKANKNIMTADLTKKLFNSAREETNKTKKGNAVRKPTSDDGGGDGTTAADVVKHGGGEQKWVNAPDCIKKHEAFKDAANKDGKVKLRMLPLNIKDKCTDLRYAIRANENYQDSLALWHGERNYVKWRMTCARVVYIFYRVSAPPIIILESIGNDIVKGSFVEQRIVEIAPHHSGDAVEIEIDESEAILWRVAGSEEDLKNTLKGSNINTDGCKFYTIAVKDEKDHIMGVDVWMTWAEASTMTNFAVATKTVVCSMPHAAIVTSQFRATQLTIRQRYGDDDSATGGSKRLGRGERVYNAVKIAATLCSGVIEGSMVMAYANGTDVRVVCDSIATKDKVKAYMRKVCPGFLPSKMEAAFREDMPPAFNAEKTGASGGDATTVEATSLVKEARAVKATAEEQVCVVRTVGAIHPTTVHKALAKVNVKVEFQRGCAYVCKAAKSNTVIKYGGMAIVFASSRLVVHTVDEYEKLEEE
ncbi:MAG: hypothetical protein AAB263_05555, partial [Planctomycetota bacterium]